MLMQILKFFNKNKKDFSLTSGERQVAEQLEDIREDHLARYRLVKDFLDQIIVDNKIMNGLDMFCGNGYGTYMIAKNFPSINIDSYDGSEEAIKMANNVYKLSNTNFMYKLFPFSLKKNKYDFIISFESLEHVEQDDLMIKYITKSLKKRGYLFISVPNENVHSLKKNPHKFHFRHYEHEVFLSKFLQEYNLLNLYGQDVYVFDNGISTGNLLSNYDMQLKNNCEGQVNIYVFQKK